MKDLSYFRQKKKERYYTKKQLELITSQEKLQFKQLNKLEETDKSKQIKMIKVNHNSKHKLKHKNIRKNQQMD